MPSKKKVGIDIDNDGKPDIIFDFKTIIILVTMVASISFSYSDLKKEIEIAKTLPLYEIQNDDFNIVNQKMDYIQMEIERMEKQIKDLEKKAYKK
mgnify:CR=1 FL=1